MRIVVGLMVLALAGCANWGKQLYVAHDTKLGIDASINTATTSGSIDLGYDRRFVTWVPRSVEIDEDGVDGKVISDQDGDGQDEAKAREVMSVIACSNLRVGIVSIDYYDEAMATGRAAVRFARALANNEQDAQDYFRCFTADEEDDE
jgi:hypothetical protein